MNTSHAFALTPAMTTSRLIRRVATSVTTAAILLTACLCPAGAPSLRDDSLRQQLVGTWTTKAFGTQELTNHSDGTARLDVTLNRLGALRYGKSLTLELTWTVQDGVMRHTVKGGSPPEKVARLVKDWGSTLEYEVIEVADDHILLEKPNADDQSRWDAKSELAHRS